MDKTLEQPKYYGVTPENEAAVSADLAKGLTLREAKNNLTANANYQARLSGVPEPYNNRGQTITSKTLGGSATPIDLTGANNAFNNAQTNAGINAAGISGAADAKITNAQKDLQDFVTQQEAQAKENKSNVSKGLMESLGLKSSAIEDKAKAYQTPEFLAKQKSSNDAYSLLQESKQAQINELSALEGSGLTDVQRQARRNEITNRYALKNANLSVTYDIANRDYQSAISNIDNATQLKLDAIQPKIDYYSALLTDANFQWNKAEENILNQKISDAKDLQTNAKDVADLYKTLLTNNPDAVTPVLTTQLHNAKTTTEFNDILARNGISLQNPLDVLQQKATIANLNSQIAERNRNNNPGGNGIGGITTDTTSFVANLPAEQKSAFSKLSALDQSNVSQLLNGDALLSDLMASRGIQGSVARQELLNKARSVDPNFSENLNKQRYEFKKTKWNNGKLFDNRTSINTALGHMATLYESAQALGNARLPKYNDIANWISKNAGNPGLVNFQYDLTVLASEIASAYKGGTAPTDQETEKIYNSLSSSFSPTQFKNVLSQSTKLMASKLTSLSQEYKNVMGAYPTEPIIQPYVLGELKTAGVDTSGIDKVLQTQGYSIQSGETPKVDVSQAKISGLTVTFPGGGTLTFPDQNTLNLFKKEQGL